MKAILALLFALLLGCAFGPPPPPPPPETAFFPANGGPESRSRLLASAMPLRTDEERQRLEASGVASILGRLQIKEERRNRKHTPTGGGKFAEYAAEEAANRGGTHIYMEASETGQGGFGTKDWSAGRFVVYRVEKDAWPKLEPGFQPVTP